MNDTLHPARSSEFLSRLHDGELSAGERDVFEAHCASCEECRGAVAAFEQTLAAYRSAATAPPAADLAARILRKIRAQSPSRRPFGVTFGIDIRWAGVFVAALLVVLVSAPLMLRRAAPPGRTEPASAIPARLLDANAEKDVARQEGKQAAAQSVAPRMPAPSPAPRAGALRLAEAPALAPAAPPPEASADEERRRYPSTAAKLDARAGAALRREAAAAESAGGEAGVSSSSDVVERALRVTVRALDGQGDAPAVAAYPSDQRLSSLRGQEFVLVVESQGRVREVWPSTADGLLSKQKARAADANKPADPSQVLKQLVFAAGDRPRRLAVRVE